MTAGRLTHVDHVAFFEDQQRRRRRMQFELDDRVVVVPEIKPDPPRSPAVEPDPPRRSPAIEPDPPSSPAVEPPPAETTNTERVPKPPKADRTVRLVLRINTGRNAGREFVLRDGTYTIGRAEEADFVLVDDTVSERHAEVVVTARRSTIEDLGSTNGTRLDDTRLRGIAILTPGDRLFFGTTELVVEPPRS